MTPGRTAEADRARPKRRWQVESVLPHPARIQQVRSGAQILGEM